MNSFFIWNTMTYRVIHNLIHIVIHRLIHKIMWTKPYFRSADKERKFPDLDEFRADFRQFS